jgi:hypothetical protein
MAFRYTITAIVPDLPRGTLIELFGTCGTVHAFTDETVSAKIGDEVSFDDQVDDGFYISLRGPS